MQNSMKTVQAVANLARLDLAVDLPPEEAEKALARFSGQFDTIVALMDTLAEVDTQGVEPLYWPLGAAVSPLREDTAERRNAREELLGNAPDQDGRFFVVPRIIG
ncbi:MAG: Asp-tRNA(Asn)/Glu-tRNA(Gln) amidotransferase subunit GatC [Deltaproteobacteria bacterium]|nr:Asp-tRNA(Asn)/Glu-tRNA(Gln) amidotransferase subunit GatC [Deltaproteobacteria bacterium]